MAELAGSSGIQALLLTDVVDSTKLSETLGDAKMATLWAAHDRCARDLLRTWRGRELGKTDGMLIMFDTCDDALAYALDYHRALASLNPPLQARAGLHIGPVILRENSKADVALGAMPLELEGIAKPMAARVMSIAGGGQTLLSADARNSLTDVSMRLESHGHWQMKGIAEPIELFEIGDERAPFVPPSDSAKAYRVVNSGDLWLPAAKIRHSLPAERDSFVGRRSTLVELARHFDAGARLVSLLGIGGSGKTRLVARFGWRWLGSYPGGVWFCDLTQARNQDGILHGVAQGLDVPLGKDDPVAQLGHAIAGRGPCLVILDNFEQVARHAEETLGKWLNRAGEAKFLVTTREVLGLGGEQVLAVSPLEHADAANLFLQRAEAVKPDFQGGDPAVIAKLVDLLDCLPLAIELAAARVRVMAPATLLSRMSERFKLLSGTGRRMDRQATLRATLDWSWELLSSTEKVALAQLSVFEGGFTLEAAESVLDLSSCGDSPWVMDVLQSLVQKSFVREQASARCDLLVSVKEYAAEHLATEGRYPGSGLDAASASQKRHGAYFASLSEDQARADKGAELDNFIQASRMAADRGDAPIAASTLEHAWSVLRSRGPFRVGVELALVVLDTQGLSEEARSSAAWVAGCALDACGRDRDSLLHLEVALASARRAGNRRLECRGLIDLASRNVTLAGHGDLARTQLETALALARELGDVSLEARSLNRLGNLAEVQGEVQEAAAHYGVALALARSAGDEDLEGSILGNLGNVLGSEGKLEQGLAHMEAALAAAQRAGNRRLEGNTLCNIGLLNQVTGKLELALSQLRASLAVVRDLGSRIVESIVLCNVGLVYVSMGRSDEAQEHFEEALVVARELEDRRTEGQCLGYLGTLHARQSRFELARQCLDLGQALLRAVSDRLSLAILLCGQAEAELLAGQRPKAQATLAEARAIADAMGVGPGSELGQALGHVGELLDAA